jgi:hypothetical protein
MAKKSQAAMEFLTTYGWAFLIIIVAIAGLTYFGVFDFYRVLPEKCEIYSSDLSCGNSYSIRVRQSKATGTYYSGVDSVYLEIKNNLMQQINITGFKIIAKNKIGGTYCVNLNRLNAASGWFIRDGIGNYLIPPEKTNSVFVWLYYHNQEKDICGIYENVGKKKTFLFEMEYLVQDSEIKRIATGEITTTISTYLTAN